MWYILSNQATQKNNNNSTSIATATFNVANFVLFLHQFDPFLVITTTTTTTAITLYLK